MCVHGDRDVPAYDTREDKIDISSPSRIRTATTLGLGGRNSRPPGRREGRGGCGVNLNETSNGYMATLVLE